MKKKQLKIKIETFGRYSKWDRNSRKLPEIIEFTNTIEAIEGNEFGMVLRILGGKGLKLDFCIKHPPFRDSEGKPEPDFIGEHYVSSNDYRFYIGDCIWLPVEDKAGIWELFVSFQGNIVASKTFRVVLPE